MGRVGLVGQVWLVGGGGLFRWRSTHDLIGPPLPTRPTHPTRLD